MATVTGVTPEQKRKLEAQVDLRLASRADTRGSSKRRTGKKMKDIRGGVRLMPKNLAGTKTPLTDEMRKHVKSYATSDAPKRKYVADVKQAYAGAETDHSKSPLFGPTKHKFGSGKTGQKRKDVRAWSENIMSAYKKRRDSGNLSASEYKGKQQAVAKRRKHLIGMKP